PRLSMATLRGSTSKPITRNPASQNARISGRPTYPRADTPTTADLFAIFCARSKGDPPVKGPAIVPIRPPGRRLGAWGDRHAEPSGGLNPTVCRSRRRRLEFGRVPRSAWVQQARTRSAYARRADHGQ